MKTFFWAMFIVVLIAGQSTAFPIPESPPSQPDSEEFYLPPQSISGHESSYDVGELVKLKMTAIDSKLKKLLNIKDIIYNWRVFEIRGPQIKEKGFKKETTDCDRICFFGTGNENNKIFVECHVTYLFTCKTDDGQSKIRVINKTLSCVVNINKETEVSRAYELKNISSEKENSGKNDSDKFFHTCCCVVLGIFVAFGIMGFVYVNCKEWEYA